MVRWPSASDEQSPARDVRFLRAYGLGGDDRGNGIVVTGRPPTAALADILKSHSLIHSAEGQLFRAAIKSASERLKIPVVEVRAKDLSSNGARVLGVSQARVEERLAAIGRAAGRPWAKDQKESFLAALLAADPI